MPDSTDVRPTGGRRIELGSRDATPPEGYMNLVAGRSGERAGREGSTR